MPASSSLVCLERSYRDYTGTSDPYTTGHSRRFNSVRPIPAAPSADHELLESTVFAALGRSGYYTGPAPFGIRAVRWAKDRSLVVRIVDSVADAYGRRVPYTGIVANQILPYGDGGMAWNGVDNLRIVDVTDRELTVTLAGTEARLSLRGGFHTNWRMALANRRRAIATYEEGARPMWNDPSREPDEFPGFSRMHREIAWLGSGLLRRVALFQSATNAFQVSGWCCDEQFKFALDTTPQAWTDHTAFESAISNPLWGLGLTPQTRWCYCDRMPNESCTCTVILTHPSSRAGGLQLRFGCTTPPKDFDDMIAYPSRRKTYKQWHRRVFPPA
ncbi:hypothetical protein [Nocardia wallacei]|uniref:hypothetical protein n=1 Tax=Nocardia wallacei TaxID=480035 RepID=UPI002454DF11|nr:hypothetical protein [Nocardia wallacei]